MLLFLYCFAHTAAASMASLCFGKNLWIQKRYLDGRTTPTTGNITKNTLSIHNYVLSHSSPISPFTVYNISEIFDDGLDLSDYSTRLSYRLVGSTPYGIELSLSDVSIASLFFQSKIDPYSSVICASPDYFNHTQRTKLAQTFTNLKCQSKIVPFSTFYAVWLVNSSKIVDKLIILSTRGTQSVKSVFNITNTTDNTINTKLVCTKRTAIPIITDKEVELIIYNTFKQAVINRINQIEGANNLVDENNNQVDVNNNSVDTTKIAFLPYDSVISDYYCDINSIINSILSKLDASANTFNLLNLDLLDLDGIVQKSIKNIDVDLQPVIDEIDKRIKESEWETYLNDEDGTSVANIYAVSEFEFLSKKIADHINGLKSHIRDCEQHIRVNTCTVGNCIVNLGFSILYKPVVIIEDGDIIDLKNEPTREYKEIENKLRKVKESKKIYEKIRKEENERTNKLREKYTEPMKDLKGWIGLLDEYNWIIEEEKRKEYGKIRYGHEKSMLEGLIKDIEGDEKMKEKLKGYVEDVKGWMENLNEEEINDVMISKVSEEQRKLRKEMKKIELEEKRVKEEQERKLKEDEERKTKEEQVEQLTKQETDKPIEQPTEHEANKVDKPTEQAADQEADKAAEPTEQAADQEADKVDKPAEQLTEQETDKVDEQPTEHETSNTDKTTEPIDPNFDDTEFMKNLFGDKNVFDANFNDASFNFEEMLSKLQSMMPGTDDSSKKKDKAKEAF